MGDSAEDHDDRSFLELLMLSDGPLSSSDHHLMDTGAHGGEDGFGFVFSGPNRSRMLCFSGECQNDVDSRFLQPSGPSRLSVSDPSCTTNICQNLNDACAENQSTKSSTKKRIGSVNGETMDHNRKSSKKCKRNQEKSSVGTAKVRKERLGERIAALQQLVSPYGKTDAASVLHEAMGYIKFLQDQIQVLCSPYLINYSLNGSVVTGDVRAGKKVSDLRSRGLCLVPVSSTVLVESSNGADFWSPATMGHTTSSSQ
ncbi:Transcription factor bHLH113 [Hirschfeldia incana]|nr:Transcription factor bHLH113 [Hirschfeldia incana]